MPSCPGTASLNAVQPGRQQGVELPLQRQEKAHSSQRQGPTMLCAAWHVLPGEALGPEPGRPRQQACLQCLRHLDRAFPCDLTLHVILDHSATPKHKTVREWLASRPRFQLHCTPTGASGLHLVESWCSQLTQQRLRRSVFCSVQELMAASHDYWTHHHADPQPFVGSTPVEAILAKASKCKVILGTHPWPRSRLGFPGRAREPKRA